VVRLVRAPTGERGAVFLDSLHPDLKLFEEFDAVVHLAGEHLASRWTARKMRAIFVSRSEGTYVLAHLLSRLRYPPKVFLSPSAVGYYGNRGEEELTENSSSGVGFLPQVCRAWEAASNVLAEKGCRVAHPRFGLILGQEGGILPRMLLLSRWGLGGILGSGNQWVSWVSLNDVLAAIHFALYDSRLHGAFNVVAPGVVRQREFAHCLAAHVHRKVFFTYPSWFLHLVMGRMADELLLASAKVRSEKLIHLQFSFCNPYLNKFLIS
jgi:uncharacterized protein